MKFKIFIVPLGGKKKWPCGKCVRLYHPGRELGIISADWNPLLSRVSTAPKGGSSLFSRKTFLRNIGYLPFATQLWETYSPGPGELTVVSLGIKAARRLETVLKEKKLTEEQHPDLGGGTCAQFLAQKRTRTGQSGRG